jgi:hypothetical protein
MKTTVKIVNSNDGSLRVILEPWGREYDLGSGEEQRLDFDGPDGGLIEVQTRAGQITVYGWTGSAIDDGINPEGPRVPATPRPKTAGR